MTTKKATEQKPQTTPDGVPFPKAFAEAMTGVSLRHGYLALQLGGAIMKGTPESQRPSMDEYIMAISDKAKAARKGDLAFASSMLAAQALSLDAIFTEMARRMAANMGEYLSATETYARIALKAQSGSRSALAELAKLHQPREQTVRHVHVNEGGQAVIADEFHHHTGGQENGQSNGQPHTPGACDSGDGTALPSPDPLGPAVPLSSDTGQTALPNARRQGKRRA